MVNFLQSETQENRTASLYSLCRVKAMRFGCACYCVSHGGYDLFTSDEIMKKILRNTAQRHRRSRIDRFVCKDLVVLDEMIGCRIHPDKTGIDLRPCNRNYACTTAIIYGNWSLETQGGFLDFLTEQRLAHVEYSKRIANGEFLRLFQARNE
jgi:hypothetical protein